MKRKLLAMVLVVVLCIGACGLTALAEEPVPFKIAFCTWAGYAPLYIAQEMGYFKELGIAPELIIVEDEAQYAAMLVSNSIQALGNVLDRDVIHYACGAPEQYLLTMDFSTGGDGIVATGDIKTMDDLAGKTVGMDKSATSYFFFLQALSDSSIKEDQVNIVEMGSSEAGDAFLAEKIDAAVTWEPFLSNASQREGGHILVSSAEYPRAIIDVLTVNSSFADKNPKAVEALEEAWYRAVEYLETSPEESYKIMAAGLGLDAEEVKGECSGITFVGRDGNAEFNNAQNEDNVYDIAALAASYWVEKGLIENSDVTGFFAK
jgi:NitT/TauT family transport system substrate-binding protein